MPRAYGVQLASEWPELRGHQPSRTVPNPTAVRLSAGHTLTMTETALAFLEDARRRSDLCEHFFAFTSIARTLICYRWSTR
ncbi:hypothetical protein [Streptomyces canus]|uniref:hypothetical protein n=1 Tax=Streptomyces canus TaxID=58343 RepID=UPI002E35A412|nr:hypothetical protein [Streptomyces canus]